MNKQFIATCLVAAICAASALSIPVRAQTAQPAAPPSPAVPIPPVVQQQPATPAQPLAAPPVVRHTPPPPTAPKTSNTPLNTSTSRSKYLHQHVQLSEEYKSFYATKEELGLSLGDSDGSTIRPTIDQDVLTSFLTKLQARVNSPAMPAHPVLVKPFVHEVALTTDNVPRPAIVVPAEPATTLLIQQSAAAITTALTQNPTVSSINLVIQKGAAPTKSTSLTGVNARLAHFVTHFDTAEVGRTQTVRRAIQLIDGTVLAPNEIFSVNKAVGERTAERGFGIGKVFINGTMENQLGGGMCQVATTLFNAALLADFKIIERHQHVRTVPYVPAGGDATVYYGEKDFQFQNNTDTPVFIYYKTYGRFAVCDLYGKANPDVKVTVVTTPTRLGPRYYKGVIKRYVTADGKTTSDFAAYSSYKWTPALDYQR